MKLEAYVDGSYNSNGHVYGSGVVLLVPGMDKPLQHKLSGNESSFARMRNVAGEILGALEAVKIAQAVNCTKLVLYYDYEGIEKWVTGSWKAKQLPTIAYRDIMQEALQKMEIEFVKVAAHTGDTYNELADKLAKEACR